MLFLAFLTYFYINTDVYTKLLMVMDMLQVVDAPEILTVIGKIPYLSEFLNSLYDCQYMSFFSAFGE